MNPKALPGKRAGSPRMPGGPAVTPAAGTLLPPPARARSAHSLVAVTRYFRDGSTTPSGGPS